MSLLVVAPSAARVIEFGSLRAVMPRKSRLALRQATKRTEARRSR